MVGAGQFDSLQDRQVAAQPVSIVGGVRYWATLPTPVPMVSAAGSG